MSTNENATNAFKHLDADVNGPLHRLFRLHNFMDLLRMALHSNESLGNFDHEEIYILQSCAGYIVEDAAELSGSFEDYFGAFLLVPADSSNQIPSPSK